MALRFEAGDPDRPRGHALLYYRTTDDAILATYVVVLPIAINPAKYIPPAFAARMAEASAVAATALPPIPEPMESVEAVKRLAELRGDDLIYGGVVTAEPERLMMQTHEVANEYAEQHRAMLERQPADAPPAAEPPDEDELRWVLMGDQERIGELAKLTGQLRHAVDGGDARLLAATVQKVERLRRHLPEKYRIGEFLAAAQRPGETGRRLAELYIDRCYKLSNEQYETLTDLDREIDALEGAR
ncbi:MAG TPA: hypothetical protein VFX49_10375 [Chloroflexota bacterium]|nr:hypothetical protein [Chloroflexota bacterium]